MNIEHIILLILSGIAVGFINTLAGGGTIISITTFMAMGLPIITATGTNRIPVMLQNLVASVIFRKKKMYNLREALKLSLPLMAGAIVSAQFTTTLTGNVFSIIFMAGLLVFAVLLFYKPESWRREVRDESVKMHVKHWVILFVIGLYGGSIYVGMGYMLIGIFVLSLGFDLIQANAIKNLMALLVAPVSIIPFILTSQVDYRMGFTHGIGNIIGAYIASKYAVNLGPKFIRHLLLLMVICSIIQTTYKLFFSSI